MGFRLFNDGLINEITLTALGVRWGWEIRKSSKPADQQPSNNDEGDIAISKILMGTKSIIYHSIGFPGLLNSAINLLRSYGTISV